VNTSVRFKISKNTNSFYSNWATLSFSRPILLKELSL